MWRRLWGPHPAENKTKMEHELVRHTISSALFLEHLFSNYGCGMVALEAFLTDKPEITPDYVEARLQCYLSTDTARRRMAEMAKAGILLTRKQGRTVFYRMNPETAEIALAFLKGEPVRLPASIAAAG